MQLVHLVITALVYLRTAEVMSVRCIPATIPATSQSNSNVFRPSKEISQRQLFIDCCIPASSGSDRVPSALNRPARTHLDCTPIICINVLLMIYDTPSRNSGLSRLRNTRDDPLLYEFYKSIIHIGLSFRQIRILLVGFLLGERADAGRQCACTGQHKE